MFHKIREIDSIYLLGHGVDLVPEGFVFHQDGQHHQRIDHDERCTGKPNDRKGQACNTGRTHLFPLSVGQACEEDTQGAQRQGEYYGAAGGN